MEISGKPGLIKEGFRMEDGGESHFGFDEHGTLMYVPGINASLCKLVWVNQNGKEDSLAFPPDIYGVTSISPDGRKIAYTQTGVNGELILLDINTGRKRILNRTGFSQGVRWYADNQNIGFSSTYQSSQTQELKLFSLSESTGQIKSLVSEVDSFSSFFINDFSKDQSWVAFQVTTKNNGEDLWIKNLKDPNQPAKPLVQTKASEWALRFSPDCQYVAYTSNTSGRYEVYVQGFPDADQIIQVSNGGGEEPVWTQSGRQVIYRNGKQWWIVEVITNDGKVQPAAPRLLFEGPYLNCFGPSFNIAPDDRLLLLKPVSVQHSATELVLVENWFEELKKLAPKK